MLRRIAMTTVPLLVLGFMATVDTSTANAQAGGSYRSPGYHYRSPAYHYRTPTYSYRSGVTPRRTATFYRYSGTRVPTSSFYYGYGYGYGYPYYNYYPYPNLHYHGVRRGGQYYYLPGYYHRH